MPYDYQNLKRKAQDNAPGLKKKVLVAVRDGFTTLSEPTDAGATVGDSVIIEADHAFEVGQGFVELYTTLATAEFIAELIGERDSRSTNPKITAFHPGLYPEGLEFAKKGRVEEWIVLVEGLDGDYLQIGQDGLECEMSYSLNSGKVDGGAKGITLNFETFGDVFIYRGAITMKPIA